MAITVFTDRVKEIGRRFVDSGLRLFDLKVVSRKYGEFYYQHDYGPDGYGRYRELQVFHNKRKLKEVWADTDTLSYLASYIRERGTAVSRGLCHGTRNGFEQRELGRLLNCDVIGTDISDTATQFPNTFEWDFHDRRDEWVKAFSFVYSNALDQAFDPQKALATWCDQVADDGLVFLEHTIAHSPLAASEMDPFGAHPMIMPYLIFEWGRGRFELADILRPPKPKANNGLEVWIFVVKPVDRGAA